MGMGKETEFCRGGHWADPLQDGITGCRCEVLAGVCLLEMVRSSLVWGMLRRDPTGISVPDHVV